MGRKPQRKGTNSIRPGQSSSVMKDVMLSRRSAMTTSEKKAYKPFPERGAMVCGGITQLRRTLWMVSILRTYS